MLITRTPLRVSFVGGGTDINAFYERSPGAVISIAIDRYFYLSMHKYFGEHGSLLKYSKTERVDSADQIEHSILRNVFLHYDIDQVDFASAADVPAGTGMGSSSAFTVGLLNLVYAYKGLHRSQAYLAERACQVEIDELGNPIGKQDQYGAAIGGLKFMAFNPDGKVDVMPLFLPQPESRRLENNLMLFYLGNQRSASALLKEQSQRTRDNTDTFQILQKMAQQARDLKDDIFLDVDAVGHALREGWELKRQLAKGISNPTVDAAHDAALAAGAIGAKLLGAGAGGFLLAYVPPERQQAVRDALSPLPLHRLKIDVTGTTTVFDDRAFANGSA